MGRWLGWGWDDRMGGRVGRWLGWGWDNKVCDDLDQKSMKSFALKVPVTSIIMAATPRFVKVSSAASSWPQLWQKLPRCVRMRFGNVCCSFSLKFYCPGEASMKLSRRLTCKNRSGTPESKILMTSACTAMSSICAKR